MADAPVLNSFSEWSPEAKTPFQFLRLFVFEGMLPDHKATPALSWFATEISGRERSKGPKTNPLPIKNCKEPPGCQVIGVHPADEGSEGPLKTRNLENAGSVGADCETQ